MALCPIWGTDAEVTTDGDKRLVDSHRAGGKYEITGTAMSALPLSDDEKLNLTNWLVEQHRSGISLPCIDSNTIEHRKNNKPLTYSEIVNRTLKFYEAHQPRVAAWLTFKLETQKVFWRFLAELQLRDQREAESIFFLLKNGGIIEYNPTSSTQSYRPTFQGYARLEELGKIASDSAQGFVAMWFDSSTSDAYEQGISKAIRDAGYRPMRIDGKEHTNKIDDEIIAEIRRSKFVIADFTCEKGKARGGVYYEAGFARGLNIPVIWTCHKSSLDDLHFDTRQYNHIVWSDPADLRKSLAARISALLGDGPEKKIV